MGGFTAAFLFADNNRKFLFLRTYLKIILMKKKPYQTKEKTVSCVEEAAVVYGQQIINGNDSVSTECLSFDTATCKSNRLTVSEYFDEIRTVLRKKV